MTFSPYIDAHPEYSALLGRSGFDVRSTHDNRETYYLYLYIRGFLAWSSGELDVSVESSRVTSVSIPKYTDRSKKRPEIYLRPYFELVFVKWFYGYPVRVVKRVGTYLYVPQKGPFQVRVNSPNTQYPALFRGGRSRAARMIKSPRAVVSGLPRSSTVRASPETAFRPFVQVDEQVVGGVYSISQTVTPTVVYQRQWTGVRTPNFGKLKKYQYPVNPHTVSFRDVRSNYCWGVNRNKVGPDYFSKIRPFTARYTEPGLPSHLPGARDKALKKIIDKAQIGIQANLAQDLAQIGQTFNLIAGNATKIYQSVRQFKRGNISQAVSILTAGRKPHPNIPQGKPSLTKSLSQNWLESQYGWKPLLQDIEGALNALAFNKGNQGYIQRVAASGTKQSFLDFPWPGNPLATGLSTDPRCQSVSTTTCRIVLRYKLSDPLKAFLAQTGFTNPINLVWEILPFSFVADWFLSIGTFLEAFTAFDGLTFLDGSQTQFTRARTTIVHDVAQTSNLNPSVDSMQHAKYQADSLILDRIKLTAFPTPTFPSLKNGLSSVTHATNAVALVLAVFK